MIKDLMHTLMIITKVHLHPSLALGLPTPTVLQEAHLRLSLALDLHSPAPVTHPPTRLHHLRTTVVVAVEEEVVCHRSTATKRLQGEGLVGMVVLPAVGMRRHQEDHLVGTGSLGLRNMLLLADRHHSSLGRADQGIRLRVDPHQINMVVVELGERKEFRVK